MACKAVGEEALLVVGGYDHADPADVAGHVRSSPVREATERWSRLQTASRKSGFDVAADPGQAVFGGGLFDDVVDVVAGEGVVLDGVAPVDGDEVAGAGGGQAGHLLAVFFVEVVAQLGEHDEVETA